MRGVSRFVVLLVLVAGCSALIPYPTEDVERPDLCNNGVDDDLDGEVDFEDPDCLPACTAAPVEVALPQMTPCPVGWDERVLGSDPAVTVCEPRWYPPADGMPTGCEATFLGDEECIPDCGGCDTGGTPFALDLPTEGPIVYVYSGYPESGDGTRSAPFHTLTEAFEALPGEGGTVALGLGTYTGPVTVPSGVTVFGACPGCTTTGTRIVSTNPNAPAVSLREGATLHGVRVTGFGFGVRAGSSLIEDVIIEDVRRYGIEVASVPFGDVVTRVRRTVVQRVREGDDGSSYGIRIDTYAGTFIVEHSWIDRVETAAWLAGTGQAGNFLDTVITNTRTRGVGVSLTAQMLLSRVLIDTGTGAGITAGGVSPTLVARDVLVRHRNTAAFDGYTYGGYGLAASSQANVTLERVRFEDTELAGVEVRDSADLSATDLVVRDTSSSSLASGFGFGVRLTESSTATVERAWLSRNRQAGMLVTGSSRIDATDLTISDTFTTVDGLSTGLGVFAEAGGPIERVRVVGGTDCGIQLDGPWTEITSAQIEGADAGLCATPGASSYDLLSRLGVCASERVLRITEDVVSGVGGSCAGTRACQSGAFCSGGTFAATCVRTCDPDFAACDDGNACLTPRAPLLGTAPPSRCGGTGSVRPGEECGLGQCQHGSYCRDGRCAQLCAHPDLPDCPAEQTCEPTGTGVRVCQR